ncbi:hypothetical protein QMK50_04960 [Pseudomonas sp. P5_152]|uniref:hypothetical protein n=1 Tax=unclassified Pseudomonas TaxID=196821 RepID=UPI00135AB973|nr:MULTISPECIES: hypothetical protein [unclassified Pseudomonas]MDX9664317.1 hypothetical protein [Pseudomonas sp. P5_152]
MSKNNTTDNEPNNTEQTINCEIRPPKGATKTNKTDTQKRRVRSADIESAADKKRGTGGLDSLGGGNLP